MDSRHGRLFDSTGWGTNPDRHWWCPNSQHGGNGKFFSDSEARGEYEVSEVDMSKIYADAARAVVAGKTTVDSAVREISRGTKMSTASVREQLNTMISVVRGDAREVSDRMTDKPKPAKAKATPTTRKKLEHVPGETFAALRDELGLTNKEVAEATGAAGMGKSSTYVYILVTEGSSINLYKRYSEALRSYVASHAEQPTTAAVT